MTRILYESHMHTPLCHHARGLPSEYAAVAWQRGLKGIIVTCHNPPIDGWAPWARMADAEFGEYVDMVAAAGEEWEGRIDVRLGLECDYAPGMEDALLEQLGRAEFHHVLGSVHPQLDDYRNRYDTGDMRALQESYFDHIAQAAETGLFDTISHPDLVKNLSPADWDPAQLNDVIEAALDRIAAAGTAMELNTSGLHKRVPEMNPHKSMLAAMHARDIPVVIGADAHVPARVAADFDTALQLLDEVGYSEVNIFLNRTRQPIRIEDARDSLNIAVV